MDRLDVMLKTLFILVFLLTEFQSIATAWETPSCSVGKTAQDILDCALKNHPEVKISEAALNRDDLLKSIARQMPPTQLDSSILSGQPGTPEGVFVDVGLSQTFELGGKRKNRIKQAVAQKLLTEAQVLESRELTALNTVLALYRLRQIRLELGAINEATTIYQRLLNNYKSRPKLAPEQEVSSSVLGLAMEETQLIKASLLEEKTSLLHYLMLATNLDDKQILSRLPSAKSKWPKFTLSSDKPTLNSDIAKANADKAISEANLKLAKSTVWPDFKLGPSFQTQTGIAGQDSAVGGNMGLTLPISSQNRGSIEYAKRDYAKSILSQQLTYQKNQNERAKQMTRYQQALNMLYQVKSATHLKTKHENLENFFEEGLISAPLVIEMHRQMIEVTRSRNVLELTALDALWRIYILEGKVLEAKL